MKERNKMTITQWRVCRIVAEKLVMGENNKKTKYCKTVKERNKMTTRQWRVHKIVAEKLSMK